MDCLDFVNTRLAKEHNVETDLGEKCNQPDRRAA